ncbi:MAG: hypothetical protein LBC63_07235 [Holophagales bacterium]|jgi:hypothetical protein|nr:hypothetical protein [Holophagales bacterium]
MTAASPLVFRAGPAHRATALILALGCLLVSGRGMSLMIHNFPHIWFQLKVAQSQAGEPTFFIWASLVAACLAVLVSGIVLVLVIVMFLLIEGTHILTDELGISVECQLLPQPIARRLGAGRILWKNVTKIERRRMYFVIFGEDKPENKLNNAMIKFLLADHLDRLIFLIIDRSPNLKLFS